MEYKERMKKYYQGFIYVRNQRESSVESIQESIKSMNHKEFIMRIPIGGKHNG